MRRGGFLWMAACLAAAVLSGIRSLKAGTEADSTEHYLTADLSQPVTAAEAPKTLAGKQMCDDLGSKGAYYFIPDGNRPGNRGRNACALWFL